MVICLGSELESKICPNTFVCYFVIKADNLILEAVSSPDESGILFFRFSRRKDIADSRNMLHKKVIKKI